MRSQIWHVAISRIFWPSHVMDLFGVEDSGDFNFNDSSLAYYIYKKSLTKSIHLLSQISVIEDGYVKVNPVVFSWHKDNYSGPYGIRSSNIVFFKKEIIQIYREFLSECKMEKMPTFAGSNDAEVAALREENATLKAKLEKIATATDDIPYTLWRVVLTMRGNGMTDKQIAESLHDKGQGLSKSQLGALLYTGTSELPATKTLQDNGTKLFQ